MAVTHSQEGDRIPQTPVLELCFQVQLSSEFKKKRLACFPGSREWRYFRRRQWGETQMKEGWLCDCQSCLVSCWDREQSLSGLTATGCLQPSPGLPPASLLPPWATTCSALTTWVKTCFLDLEQIKAVLET